MNDLNRVVILNDYATVQGGAAQVAIMSALALRKEGIPVVFIYGCGECDNRLLSAGVECIRLNQYDLLGNPSKINAALTGLWNRNSALKLDDILNNYDRSDTIIHLHSWVKSLSPSILFVLKKRSFPVVVTLHDYFSACPNGAFYDFVDEEICHEKPLSSGCITRNCDSRSYSQKLWRVLRQIITKKVGMPYSFKYFIQVSEFSSKILSKYLAQDAKCFIVENPIEICASDGATQVIETNKALPSEITYIGRLEKEKGVELLLEVFDDSGGEGLRIVGSGALEPILKERLPNAIFEGWQDRDGILSALGKSQVLVFTSRWYETQGLTVAEAASIGVPCIVSDACAGRESVVDGETGLWFTSGDSSDLKNKIDYFKSHPEIAINMGNRAYERFWSTPPSPKAHAKKLITTYKEIIDLSEKVI